VTQWKKRKIKNWQFNWPPAEE